MVVQVKQLGRLFDLSRELDRVELVLSLVRACYLMTVMARSVPEVIGRVPLYGRINRGPRGCEEYRYFAVACWHAVLMLTCRAGLVKMTCGACAYMPSLSTALWCNQGLCWVATCL